MASTPSAGSGANVVSTASKYGRKFGNAVATGLQNVSPTRYINNYKTRRQNRSILKASLLNINPITHVKGNDLHKDVFQQRFRCHSGDKLTGNEVGIDDCCQLIGNSSSSDSMPSLLDKDSKTFIKPSEMLLSFSESTCPFFNDLNLASRRSFALYKSDNKTTKSSKVLFYIS